ncbi:hypothetical protein THIOKS11610006 [Thiocapsa sp. KS1]|nr:hypothetical protein THIOKS11610006 [Thiocapsa sp. KS1]
MDRTEAALHVPEAFSALIQIKPMQAPIAIDRGRPA